MPESLEQVRMNDLDLDERLFTCSYPEVPDSLVVSIRRVGLLQPPLLVPWGDRLAVASGYRRVRAAREAGLDKLTARILAPPVPPAPELFTRNLEDNLATRALNLFEKARAVSRLYRDLDGIGDEIRVRCLASLEIRSERRRIEDYLELDRLEDPVKRFILEKNLPDRVAMLFIRIERGEGVAMAGLAERLRFTASQVREVLTYGSEIAGRENTRFGDLLRALEARIDPKWEDPFQRRAEFFRLLMAKRFPDYEAARSRIEAALAGINGIAGIRVAYPTYLEGDEFSAWITFRSPEELARLTEALLGFSESAALKEAMNILD